MKMIMHKKFGEPQNDLSAERMPLPAKKFLKHARQPTVAFLNPISRTENPAQFLRRIFVLQIYE
jgi:hypothetical protein